MEDVKGKDGFILSNQIHMCMGVYKLLKINAFVAVVYSSC